MKARVKATGEIIEISEECSYIFAEHYDKQYDLSELEFVQGPMRMEIFPDYWTHLKHTYAGMAMQGIMSYIEQITPKEGRSYCDEIVNISFKVAHALVEKVRYEENPKELEGLKKELEALKIEKTILENKIKLLKEESK